MATAEIGLFAILAYTLAFVSQIANSKKTSWQLFLLATTWLAIAFHGLQLHQLIDLPQGQNLSWVNLLSLLTWLSGALILLANFILPVSSLNFFLYPASIITIGLTEFLHPRYIIVTQYQPKMLLHILLATLVVALLITSAIQAVLLVIQQFALKKKRLLSLLQLLPPLQTMERLLFFDITLCFISLSAFLLLTFIDVDVNLLKFFWYENLLSLLLWLIFLLLLIGRYYFKWRSTTAAILACLGVSIALLVYLTKHLG